GAFDVSDLDNITLLDTYLPSQKPAAEVHNVRVKGNFLVNPSYGGQLTIVDATRPDNLIETAWAILGNSLVWDADPYLPSGIVFATAKSEGFFVFQPTYQHAAWLEGFVTDSLSGQPLSEAKVFVLNTPNADTSKFNGSYKTGAAMPGPYTVQVLKPGYQTKLIQNVWLETAEVTSLNIALVPEVISTQYPDVEKNIRVAPSPFRDRMVVEISPDRPFAGSAINIRLSDLSGKIIVEKNAMPGQTVLDNLGNLPVGTYLLTMRNGSAGRYTVRVVKQ
ncbi:MAG TPA: carboxypeptidase regulatory-like domain-containing protein, partial [Saprospiraceae bacterium]|nr:carboxypeptidase regulatory-like domain-containing protein [Saprospiraceae bacterium]